MPLRGATYESRDAEDVRRLLEAELREEYGVDIDLSRSSPFKTFSEALAATDTEVVDDVLEEITKNSFIDSAEGEALDLHGELVGVQRRDAVFSTGVIEFRHGDTTDQTYTLPSGTVVKTQGSDPKAFNTLRGRSITLFDDFESGSLSGYSGTNSSEFSATTPQRTGLEAYQGDNVLTGTYNFTPCRLLDTSQTVRRGSVFDFRFNIDDNIDMGNLFAVQSDDEYYRIRIDTFGTDADTHAIEYVSSSGTTVLASVNQDLSSDEWLRNEVRWDGQNDGRVRSIIYDSNGNELSSVTATGVDELVSGGHGFEIVNTGGISTAPLAWDQSGLRTVIADARADESGPDSNVAANSLNTVPSVPSGVQTITNPYAMGDPSRQLNTLEPFSSGRTEEDDDTLRQRITESADGKATLEAIIDNVRALPEAISVSGFQNKTTNDNTGSGGLPPKSFEIVYYGNDANTDVAEAIFEAQAVTSNDYGGARGVAASGDYTAENGQTFTINWTEPSEVSISATIDIVVDGTYVGDGEVADRLTEIVGGERTDGSVAIGLGAGEDVYVDQIEDEVVGVDDTGVIGISNISFTPSATTDGNGLSVVSVGDTEVPILDAANVTINTTTV